MEFLCYSLRLSRFILLSCGDTIEKRTLSQEWGVTRNHYVSNTCCPVCENLITVNNRYKHVIKRRMQEVRLGFANKKKHAPSLDKILDKICSKFTIN